MVQHINGYGLKSRRLGRAIAQSPELLLHSPAEFDTVSISNSGTIELIAEASEVFSMTALGIYMPF